MCTALSGHTMGLGEREGRSVQESLVWLWVYIWKMNRSYICVMVCAHTVMDESGNSVNIKRLLSQIPVSIISPGLSGVLVLFFDGTVARKLWVYSSYFATHFLPPVLPFRAKWQKYKERKMSKRVYSQPLGILALSIRDEESPSSKF